MGSNSWIVKHRRGIGLYVGVWLVLGLLMAAEVFIAQQIWDKPISWGLALRRSSKEMLAYAICTLAVLWLCGRVPHEAGRRARWFIAHMLGALTFSVLHVALVSWLEAGERSVQTGEILTFSYLFEKLLVSYTLSNIFKYWIFVLGYLGWHYYKATASANARQARSPPNSSKPAFRPCACRSIHISYSIPSTPSPRSSMTIPTRPIV